MEVVTATCHTAVRLQVLIAAAERGTESLDQVGSDCSCDHSVRLSENKPVQNKL
jgi:hypothetical protein